MISKVNGMIQFKTISDHSMLYITITFTKWFISYVYFHSICYTNKSNINFSFLIFDKIN